MAKDKKDKRSAKSASKGENRPKKAARALTAATDALVKQGSRILAKSDKVRTIGALEQQLLKLFPADTAESWDRCGLLVGERALPITKVAITLDPTVDAIEEAAKAGANVLLTHHPAYLDPPASFAPERSVALSPGAGVFAAIRSGVALMAFHTSLDVSKQAQVILPKLLGLSYTGKVLAPLEKRPALGYGQVCKVSTEGGKPEALAHIAARCTSVFGRAPRVWGSFSSTVARVVCATGSAGSLGKQALAAGVDCLICGEVKYHEALEFSEAGLCIIELGHDLSEFPLTAVLADATASFGLSSEDIVILDQTERWSYPESIRL